MNRNICLIELLLELLSHDEDYEWCKCWSVSTSFICGALPNNNSPHINREYQNCAFSCCEICFPAQKIHHFGHVITGAHHNDPSISMVYCCMSMGQVAFDQALLYWQSYQLKWIWKGCHDRESSHEFASSLWVILQAWHVDDIDVM
jgi:hypothetical protein